MNLNGAIDTARRRKGYSWTDLARRVGVNRNTLLNMRTAATVPRDEHVHALEEALGWNDGDYWAIREGRITDVEPAAPTPAPGEQTRAIGTLHTPHGTLTWIKHGNTRDYTLSREILGKERSTGVSNSTLPPAEAAEELAPVLAMMEKFFAAQTEKNK